MWTPSHNQYSGHIFKVLSHLSISVFFIQTVQPRAPTPSSPSQVRCQLWMSASNSDVLPHYAQWQVKGESHGNRTLAAFFLKKKKKFFFLNCNIVLLPAAVSVLSEGDIVCEPNWSFRRHLNPRLCSKSLPRTSDADFFFLLYKKTFACQFLWHWHVRR